MRRPILWRISCIAFLLISAIAFTPLVIPHEADTPYLFGMPRTLWAGITVSVALLIVILLGAWATGDASEGGEA